MVAKKAAMQLAAESGNVANASQIRRQRQAQDAREEQFQNIGGKKSVAPARRRRDEEEKTVPLKGSAKAAAKRIPSYEWSDSNSDYSSEDDSDSSDDEPHCETCVCKQKARKPATGLVGQALRGKGPNSAPTRRSRF